MTARKGPGPPGLLFLLDIQPSLINLDKHNL